MLNLLLGLRSVLARDRDRAGRSQSRARSAAPGRSGVKPAPVDEVAAERVLAGGLIPLRHLVRVAPGTVVYQFSDDGEVLLREPGDVVIPGPSPLHAAVRVVAVTTDPVRLVVTVTDLETADGVPVSEISVDVGVQVQQAALTSTVAQLAHSEQSQLGRHLADSVGAAIGLRLRAAVRSSPAADLGGADLAVTLDRRWLPRSFLGGALLRVGQSTVSVSLDDRAREVPETGSVGHSALPVDRPTDPSEPRPERPRGPLSAEPTPAPDGRGRTLELSVDVRLRRLWRQRLGVLPLGIAGGTVGTRSTVIAVVSGQPPAYQTSEVREDFGALYADRSLTLIVVDDPSDYSELVDQWVAALELGTGVAAHCSESADQRDLDVVLSGAPRGPRWQGPEGSPVVALRRLLPFRRVVVSMPGAEAEPAELEP